MYAPQEQLSERVTLYWRIARLFQTAFFSMPFSVLLFFVVMSLSNFWLALVVSFLFLVYRFVYSLIWPSLEHEYYRFEIRDHDILVQHGVLFRKWSSIPMHRVQHVDTHQGPLERIIGLVTLRIYTAAGNHFDGAIPGLQPEKAKELQETIIQNRGDDGV